jgi:hypothetical protein
VLFVLGCVFGCNVGTRPGLPGDATDARVVGELDVALAADASPPPNATDAGATPGADASSDVNILDVSTSRDAASADRSVPQCDASDVEDATDAEDAAQTCVHDASDGSFMQ